MASLRRKRLVLAVLLSLLWLTAALFAQEQPEPASPVQQPKEGEKKEGKESGDDWDF